MPILVRFKAINKDNSYSIVVLELFLNATNGKTAHEVRAIVARPYLRHSCNFASTSDGSPAREHKSIVRASYGCLTFSENQL